MGKYRGQLLEVISRLSEGLDGNTGSPQTAPEGSTEDLGSKEDLGSTEDLGSKEDSSIGIKANKALKSYLVSGNDSALRSLMSSITGQKAVVDTIMNMMINVSGGKITADKFLYLAKTQASELKKKTS